MIRRTLCFLALAACLARPAASDPFANQVLQLSESGGPLNFVTVNDHPDLRPAGDFTIELWVRVLPQQTESPYPIILTKPAGNMLNGECSYGFIVERTTGNLLFRVTTATGTYDARWAGNLMDGQWHHLNGRRTTTGGSSLLNLDVDGVPGGSRLLSGATLYSSEPLAIGASMFTGYNGNALVGQVDEVRVWNVSHTAPTDRLVVFNRADGLAAVWHFDDLYPDEGGYRYFLDSVKGLKASRWNAATPVPGSPPHQRGWGVTVLDVMSQVAGSGQRRTTGAVRVPGGRDIVYRRLLGLGTPGTAEIDVVKASGSSGVQGSLSLPAATPVVRMVARDSVVFCVKEVTSLFGSTFRLFPVRVSDPSHPQIFGDSLDVKASARMLVDPTAPQLLVTGGTSVWGDVVIDLVDVTNVAQPVLQYEAVLGGSGSLGTIVDIAKRGAYFYVSFSDGLLRIYRYTVFVFNGNVVRSLDPVGTPMNLGGRCALGIGETRLYVAGRDGSFRVYDLASPAAPALQATIHLDHMIAEEVQVSGTRVGVAGPNGVHIVNASNLANVLQIATYCPDMPAEGDARLSLSSDFIGITASLGGYTLLTTLTGLAVPAVDAPVRLTLAAGPNPARGAVGFQLPAELDPAAELEIHDVAGRRVRRWSAVSEARGRRWIWDGRGEDGAPVPAGIYLTRLVEPGRVHTARIAIVR